MRKSQSLTRYGLLFTVLFLVDRVTKALILWWGTDELRVAPFLSFKLCFNRGISWGLLHSSGTGQFILVTALTIAVIILLSIYAYTRWSNGCPVWGETLALTGALSNLIDRFFYGGVIDFILFSVGDWSWPLFNIADASIVVGVFLILLTFSKEGY